MKRLTLKYYLPILFVSGCSSSNEFAGSYEEAPDSGRVAVVENMADYQDSRRFFRFHFSQFDADIGGTFETFDMSSYAMFEQVPVYMSYSTKGYYCSRIDYGYSRNGSAHILFTDREQRQWQFDGELKGGRLAGTITRVSAVLGMNDYSLGNEYQLPQDQIFAQQQDTEGVSQIMMNDMDSDISKSLDCLYYFKTTEVSFYLPDELTLDACKPSAHDCQSLRLAIVGGPVVSRFGNLDPSNMQTVMTARLDDCDISTARTRKIRLRDNPHVFSNSSSKGLFFATAIVFEDNDLNGEWDVVNEPVLAVLDNQVLLFYDEPITNSVFGRTENGDVFDLPVIQSTETNPVPGWYVYSEDSVSTLSYRLIRHLSPDSTLSLALSPVISAETGELGCFLKPETESQTVCSGIIPILYQ